jgi:hypothetical protein
LVVRGKEIQTIDLRQPVRQEAFGEVEAPASDHIAIDIPSDALGHLDTFGVTRGKRQLVAGRIAWQAWQFSFSFDGK